MNFAILAVPISVTTVVDAIEQVNSWVDSSLRARLVAFANVHMVVEAVKNPDLYGILTSTDLNCPDGAPISWLGRTSHGKSVTQVPGPEFMPRFCEQSVERGHRHFLYGGVEGVAAAAGSKLQQLYPGLKIVGSYAPPFGEISPEADEDICRRINESGADVLWVGLGCPKQEKWMFEHRDRLKVKVILSVGQAFDIVAGTRKRAPELMRRLGFEWAYRLVREPRRLWKRYLTTNFLFIAWLLRDLLIGKKFISVHHLQDGPN